ncbi:hypothetical protein G9A89_021036 [Geosiphon pyriformis]|nr:hypothetical protein G9A89_021036 [Geosiphon pyriformis]
MSKKKIFKDAFHGPAGEFFSQKKKVVLGNIKHSGDKKDISLSKSGSNDSIYSNIDSLSGDNENISITGANSGSFLGLVTTIFKKAVVEFAKLSQTDQLAAKWSFLIGKNSVCIAKTVGNYNV